MKSNIRIFKGAETKTAQYILVVIHSTADIYGKIKKFAIPQSGIVYYGNTSSNRYPDREIVVDFFPSQHPRMARPYKSSTNATYLKFNIPIGKTSKFIKKVPFYPDETKAFIKDKRLHIPLIEVASNKSQQTNLKLDKQQKDKFEAEFKRMPDLIMAKMLNDETFISKLANTVAFKLQPQFMDLAKAQDDGLQKFADKLISYWESPVKPEETKKSQPN